MAVFLPDVIGEYVDGPVRFETGGVQYGGYFDPPQIAPEEITHLFLFFQNTFNAPVAINLKVNMPTTGGLFRGGQPILKVEEPIIQIKLASAEAGLLTLPVTTGEEIKPGEYSLGLNVKVASQGRADRIRPTKSKSILGKGFIDSPVGLNLVSTMGATFTEKSVKKVAFSLNVSGKPSPPERAPQLQHKFQSIWIESYMELFNKAIQEINSREVKFKKELTVEALYAMLYAESTTRFADAGVPLRIGEAIILAKILTYSCQYFLSNPNRRNGLLVPIWERALEAEADTTDVIEVIRTVGYYHVLKLAGAISFGVVAKGVGRHNWPLIERQAVVSHIADSIEVNQEMDVDFLYLPLLMAGVQISNKLKLNGENPSQTLDLIKRAYEARLDLFSDAEMDRANKIFNQILKKALQQA
jgi:hypothetical protein